MSIEEMEDLILLLKDFKEELTESEDKRYVNIVMRMIDNTISEAQYYK